MNRKKTVVITGMIALTRRIFLDNPKYTNLDYYQSIVNAEKMIGLSNEQYYQFLLREQLEKDKHILENKSEDSLLLIEEWHIGNIAWIGTINKDDAQKYEMSVQEQIVRLSKDITIWYVSTDIEKFFGKEADKYRLYLEGLTRLSKKYGLTYETLDGDVNFDLLDKRISYLLRDSDATRIPKI